MSLVGFMVVVPFVVHFASDLRSHSFQFLCRAEWSEVILEQELTEETEFLDFISVVSC